MRRVVQNGSHNTSYSLIIEESGVSWQEHAMHKGGEMGKPVLFVIDDEPEDQQAFERDLRMKYAETFQHIQANGPWRYSNN